MTTFHIEGYTLLTVVYGCIPMPMGKSKKNTTCK